MSIIRRLNQGEAALYREVRLASLRESPGAFASRYEDAIARSDRSWRDQADASAAGRDRATFIILDGEPVGLAALYRDPHAREEGELIQMWVAPEKRGGPLAAELIGEIFRWAADNGYSRVRAEVMRDNPRALRFYRKCGFTAPSDGTVHAGSSVILTRPVE